MNVGFEIPHLGTFSTTFESVESSEKALFKQDKF